MGETECLVLGLYPILEVSLQFLLSLRRITRYSILRLELLAAYLIQFHKAWCRQIELILESIGHRRIIGEEIVKSLCQTGDNHNGIIIPMVHLDK